MNSKFIYAFICLAIIAASSIVYAQQFPNKDRFGSGFHLDRHGVPYSNKYFPNKPESNVISLVRKPELKEDQFILRITDPHMMNGCTNMSDYITSAEYKDMYLDIAIYGNIVDLRDQPQYAHFQCNQQSKVPVADIVLNRSDILKNETQQIRLHNGNDTNYYNIKLGTNKVLILPDSSDVAVTRRFKPHNIPGRKTSLVYWFYPLGTVIMWVPGMENGPAETGKLKAFAKQKGLTPLDTVFPDFKSPLTGDQFHYFVDTAGHFEDDDPDLAYGKPIGNIFIDKQVYGLEKDEIELDELVVYARRPGLYD